MHCKLPVLLQPPAFVSSSDSVLHSSDDLPVRGSRVILQHFNHFLVGLEGHPGGLLLSHCLLAGDEAHSGVAGAHLRGSQTTSGLLEDAADGWQIETTTALRKVESMSCRASGKT